MAAPNQPPLVEEATSESLPVKHLQFKAVPTIQLEEDASKQGSLVACNKYGVVIVTMDRHLYILRFEDILEGKLAKIPIPSHRPTIVSFSADEEFIALDRGTGTDDQLLIIPTSPFIERNGEAELLCSMQIPSGVKRVYWSPAEKQRLAVLGNDSSLMAFEIVGINNFVTHKAPFKDITCACWSPKGKQIVIGRSNGAFSQLKLDLTIAKNIDGVGIFPHDIFWDTPKNFLIFAQQGEDYNFLSLDLETGKAPHYRNYGDVFLSDGVDVPRCFFVKWGDSIICASSTSNEVLVFGKGADGIWKLLDLDDNTRASLPFGHFAIAASPFLSSKKEIVTSTEPLPPAPIILFLAHQTLLPFHYIDSKVKFTPIASRSYVPPQQVGAQLQTSVPSKPTPPVQTVNVSTPAKFSFSPESKPPPAYTPSPVQVAPVKDVKIPSPLAKTTPSREEVDSVRSAIKQMASEDLHNQENYQELIQQIEDFDQKLKRFKSEDAILLSAKMAEYEEVQKSLVTKVTNMVKYWEGIGEASTTLLTEVSNLKSRVFSQKASIVLTQSKVERNNDPEYMALLRSQKMSPKTFDKVKNIERLFNYIKKQIKEVRQYLYFEKQRPLGSSASFKFIFIALDNHAKIINGLNWRVKDLRDCHTSQFIESSLKVGEITKDISQINLCSGETEVNFHDEPPNECLYTTAEIKSLQQMLDELCQFDPESDDLDDQSITESDTEDVYEPEERVEDNMKMTDKIKSLISVDQEKEIKQETSQDQRDAHSVSISPQKPLVQAVSPTMSGKSDGSNTETPIGQSQSQPIKQLDQKPLFATPPLSKDLFKPSQPLFETKGLLISPSVTITPISQKLPITPPKEPAKTSIVNPQPSPMTKSPVLPMPSQDFGSGDLLKHLLTTSPTTSTSSLSGPKPTGLFQFSPSVQKTPLAPTSSLFQLSSTDSSVFSSPTIVEVKEKANEEKTDPFTWTKPKPLPNPSTPVAGAGGGDTLPVNVSSESKNKSEFSSEISKFSLPSFASTTSEDSIRTDSLSSELGISNVSSPSFVSSIGESFTTDKGRLSTIQEEKSTSTLTSSIVSTPNIPVGASPPLFQSTPKVDSFHSSSSTVSVPSGLFSLSFSEAPSPIPTVSSTKSTDPNTFSFTVPQALNENISGSLNLSDSTLKNTSESSTLVADRKVFGTLSDSTVVQSIGLEDTKSISSTSTTLPTPGLFQTSSTFGTTAFSGLGSSSTDTSGTTMKNLFGQTTSSASSPPSGLFGSSTPGFQSPSFVSPLQKPAEPFGSSLFGSSPFTSPTKFGSGGSGVFGGDSSQTPQSPPSPQSPFGPQVATPKSPTSPFGVSPFGQQAQGQNAFGTTSPSSLFGGSSFASSPPATNIFGNSSSLFGSSTQSQNTFGSATQTQASTGFGAFGQQQQTQPQQNIFGGQANKPQNAFGVTSAQQPPDNLFGSAFSGLGSPAQVSNTPDRNVFGGGSFGSNTSATAGIFGSPGGSTGFQSQTSFQTSPKPVSSGFGAPAVFGGSPFAAPASSSFGSTGGSIFGGSAALQSTATFGAIAQKSSFGSFDQSATNQSNAPVFGGGSVFGGNAFQTGATQNTFGGGSSIFGGSATQGAPTFGAVSQQAPQSTFGSFGQPQQQQQQPSAFGGQPAQTQPSSFGGNSFSSWR